MYRRGRFGEDKNCSSFHLKLEGDEVGSLSHPLSADIARIIRRVWCVTSKCDEFPFLAGRLKSSFISRFSYVWNSQAESN
jgi:hypothetical protein